MFDLHRACPQCLADRTESQGKSRRPPVALRGRPAIEARLSRLHLRAERGPGRQRHDPARARAGRWCNAGAGRLSIALAAGEPGAPPVRTWGRTPERSRGGGNHEPVSGRRLRTRGAGARGGAADAGPVAWPARRTYLAAPAFGSAFLAAARQRLATGRRGPGDLRNVRSAGSAVLRAYPGNPASITTPVASIVSVTLTGFFRKSWQPSKA